jgi:GNAT superfamily N-acetyltransferase
MAKRMTTADSSVSIRPIQLDDIPDVVEVAGTAWRAAYGDLFPDEVFDQWSPAEAAERWREIVADPERTTLVAEVEGRVCGYVGFGRARDDDLDPAHTAEIYGIYVHPEWWGQGLGWALLQAAYRVLTCTASAARCKCVERGYRDVSLWTMRDNARARQFYERAGLTWDGQTKESERGIARFVELRYVGSLE